MKIYAVINACSPDTEFQTRNIRGFLSEGIAGKSLTEQIRSEDIAYIRISGSAEDYIPEAVLDKLTGRCADADLVIFPGNDSGCELAIRLGARLGGAGLTDVTGIDIDRETISRKVYAGNLIGEYRLKRKPWCISADKTFGDKSEPSGISYENLDFSEYSKKRAPSHDRIITEEAKGSGLKESAFVVAAGQGLKTENAAKEASRLAEALGAAFGVSRPAAMNGWEEMNRLIGVSGNMISPEVCIAAAVSGAPAFFEGIQGSRTIIAINSDENAPIMKKADLAVKGDAIGILTALADMTGRGGE